ncbi:MAG: hypothetical protein KIS73_08590 [Enhydrobacter sp.]|nr:hypothetical protein [Enhydrobacter sp.]
MRYGADMLQVVGDSEGISRAIACLCGSLKGVPARGVRLTWRGGELRTAIHWARDDGFWWAVESRADRDSILLGHAPEAPGKRETITCSLNLVRAGNSRRTAGIIAADSDGKLYLAHSGRMGGGRVGQHTSAFRDFLADGVWRTLEWPDGRRSVALVVAPLNSPRLMRLIGQFVEGVHRFKAGDAPARRAVHCVQPSRRDSAMSACDRRLVDVALHEELAKRGLFGGAPDLFSLRGERPRPLFAVVAGSRDDELARAVKSLAHASARRRNAVLPILVAPQQCEAALSSQPFACVRYTWRGARAVFDGLDDALA